MCEYCEKPYKTLVTHDTGVSAFVGVGCLWLRFYNRDKNQTIVNTADIKYCPMCGRKFKENIK